MKRILNLGLFLVIEGMRHLNVANQTTGFSTQVKDTFKYVLMEMLDTNHFGKLLFALLRFEIFVELIK
jgi:hypothetical protein